MFLEDAAYRVLQNRGYARHPYDPARARQLFAEAGLTAGAVRTYAESARDPHVQARAKLRFAKII